MKRRTFIKSLGLAVLAPAVLCTGKAATGETNALGATGTVTGPTNTLRVLTCNVRVDVPADNKAGNGWAHRRELCAQVIGRQQADLVGFQEMQVAHFDDLLNRLRVYAPFAIYHPGNPPQPQNAIFYAKERFDLISAGGFWLSQTPHVAGSRSWESSHARFVVWVDLKDRRTGKSLRYWNTHLDHLSHPARENGARMIVEAAAALPTQLPQLITGDFNAGANHRAIQTMLQGGWTDTYAAIHGPGEPGFTAHAFQGKAASPLRPDGTRKEKIDWIFCRGPMTPTGAAIIRDGRAGRYPSDHFFVSATVTM